MKDISERWQAGLPGTGLSADQRRRAPDVPECAGKTPGLSPAHQVVNSRAGEQRRTMDTNRSDRGRPRLLDPPDFGPAPKPSPASSASCEIGPPHLLRSYRSLSSETRLQGEY